MSTTQRPLESKLWADIVAKTAVVENDLTNIVGPTESAKLEAWGKNFLSTWAGPLAQAALTDATDAVSGEMSVSAACTSFIALAAKQGKTVSQAAALQVIALAQNSLPVESPISTEPTTVTPVA